MALVNIANYLHKKNSMKLKEKNELKISMPEEKKECNKNVIMEPKSMHWKVKRFFKLIIVFASVGFLMYQTLDLTQQFLKYQTLVMYRLENKNVTAIPSFTICYDRFFPHRTLYDKYEEYRKAIKDIKNLNWFAKMNPIWFEEEDLTDIGIAPIDLIEHFNDLLFKNMSLIEAFNMSVNIFDDMENTCTVNGFRKTNPNDTHPSILRISCDELLDPIESINDGKYCITYLSQLSAGKNVEQHNMSIKGSINIRLHFDSEQWSLPYDTINKLKLEFAIHPPSMIPSPYSVPFTALQFGQEYNIKFMRTVSYLLPNPYVTNCNEYNLGNQMELQSENDCIMKCFKEKIENQCMGCTPRQAIIRREMLKENDFLCDKSDSCSNSEAEFIYDDCDESCKANCKELTLDYSIDENTDQTLVKTNRIAINIQHKHSPDTIVTHTPELDWTSFVADIGGLAGIWMGLNVVLLYDYILTGYQSLRKSFRNN